MLSRNGGDWEVFEVALHTRRCLKAMLRHAYFNVATVSLFVTSNPIVLTIHDPNAKYGKSIIYLSLLF